MVSLTRYIMVSILLSAILFCAQRDNLNDPQSPLFHELLPNLKVGVTPESSRLITQSSDSIMSVMAPLTVKIKATSTSAENASEVFPVLMVHTFNGQALNVPTQISDSSIQINDTGTHIFHFETHQKPHDSKISKNVILNVNASPVIQVSSFDCNKQLYPINHQSEVRLTTMIIDSSRITDEISYEFSSRPTQIHKITNHSQCIIFDTLSYKTEKYRNDTEHVTLKIKDLLGRVSISRKDLIFDKNAPCSGLPPVINLISNTDEAEIYDSITFITQSSDPDGHIVKYDWSFGDDAKTCYSDTSIIKQFYHQGTYKIKVSAEDDSGCVSSDSVSVVIKPLSITPPKIIAVHQKSEQTPFGNDFRFSVEATGTILKYQWFFENKDTITDEPECEHTFYWPMSIPIKVCAIGVQGQKDIAYCQIKVNGNIFCPPFIFVENNDNTHTNERVYFMFYPSSLQVDSTAELTWHFPDGVVTTTTLYHTYKFRRPGEFNIKVDIKGAQLNHTCYTTVKILP